jgi:hypothetical protein
MGHASDSPAKKGGRPAERVLYAAMNSALVWRAAPRFDASDVEEMSVTGGSVRVPVFNDAIVRTLR